MRSYFATALGIIGAICASVIGIVVSGRLASSATQHAVILATAGALAAVVVWFAFRREPWLRGAVLTSGVGTVLVAVVAGGLASRPTTVNENVVTAPTVEARRSTVPAEPASPSRATPRPASPTEPLQEVSVTPVVAQPKQPAAAATPKPATETQNVLVTSGQFEALEHPGRGTASVIRTADDEHVLTLTKFETDAVPDPFVWLVAGNPADDDAAESADRVSLGKLKGSSGDQQYKLPPGTDPSKFTHVYVWCRVFASGVTRAPLV